MNRISRVTERRELHLYYQGYSRDTITQIFGVPAKHRIRSVRNPTRGMDRSSGTCDRAQKTRNIRFRAKKGAELGARLEKLDVAR